jgi:deoxyribonuclease V
MRSIVALDVQYTGDTAVVGSVMFESWRQEISDYEWVQSVNCVAPYTPGKFYRRELPCLLAALERAPHAPDLILIDGYVWLSKEGRAGLGAHLFRAFGQKVPIVGVAKTKFRGAPARKLLRGKSRSPLFITAAGCDPSSAAFQVGTMAGQHRIPILLKRVDQLARKICIPYMTRSGSSRRDSSS